MLDNAEEKKKLSRGRDVKCWKRAEILDMQVTEVIFGKRDEGNEGASCTRMYRKSIPGRGNNVEGNPSMLEKSRSPLWPEQIRGERLRGGEARPWEPCGIQ